MKLEAKIRSKVKSRFFENEAELSGSDEAPSDEDDDLREEDDVMMEEEGDQDDMPDEEELIEQIGGIHAKRERDEDARRLKVIQDLIFEDGDLDADGGAQGRAQNFRWKNIDDVGDDDDDAAKGGDDDDDDDDDSPLVQTMEETEAQKKWRKQQFEREQWKKERSMTNEGSENTTVNDVEGEKSVVDMIADDSENSMFLMMGTKVLKEKSLSNASPLLRQSSNSKSGFNTDPANSQSQDMFRSKFGFGSIMSSKTPSEFLRASSDSSSKSSVDVTSRGLAAGSNFAFKTLSPKKRKEEEEPQAEVKPAKKKQKVSKKQQETENSQPRKNSIFQLFG